jgi:glycosyltransferase involved in cell wall biosynthesis
MKILHLISGGDEGGAKTHVITLLKELSNHIDVTLVCLIEGNFAKEARKQGINVVIIEQDKRYDLNILNSIIDILKDDYDILHCHGARANFLGMLIKKRYYIPTVSTIHSDYKLDFDNSLYKKMVYTPLNYFSLKRFEYFIAITEQFKNMLVKRGFKNEKIYVSYNGISITERKQSLSRNEFLGKYNMEYEENNTYVGIVTRLHPVKGIPVFLKAAAKVLTTNDNVKFLIAGNGEKKYTDKYKQFVSDNGLEKNIIFLGFVRDIHNFYNNIDINVLTSHSESFPYALLEGGLSKKPTICSAVGGIPEMITHEETGMLFEDNKYKELAKYIEELVNDQQKRIELGEALFDRIKNNFSDKNMAKMHMQIYKHILAK